MSLQLQEEELLKANQTRLSSLTLVKAMMTMKIKTHIDYQEAIIPMTLPI